MKNKIINFTVIALVSIFSLAIGAKAATTIAASQVTYKDTTVQAKVDELVNIVNNIVPIDPNTFATNSAKTIYASSKGVCIKRNGKLNCFKINNYDVEKDHVQEVFSEINCSVYSTEVNCRASDFICGIYPDGDVICNDISNGSDSTCLVDSDGSVDCNDDSSDYGDNCYVNPEGLMECP